MEPGGTWGADRCDTAGCIRWEAGTAKPDADKIIAICDLFGVSADYLLRDISAVQSIAEHGKVSAVEKRSTIAPQVVGLILLSLSLVLVVLFAVYASVNGGTHHIMYGEGTSKSYHGMMALVTRYDLQWLLWLFAAMGVLGSGLTFGPWILETVKKITSAQSEQNEM